MPTRKQQMTEMFRQRFSGEPELWTRAPGRVDLMGSHTDYNLGYVLTLPISRDTWIAARPRTDGVVRVYSANLDDEAAFQADSIEFDDERSWSHYLRAVAAVLAREGLEVNGFDGVVDSTVPIGSGLSSSAALECALATMFQALSSWRLDAALLARLCQRAENEFVGVNCGILDQFSSSLGHAGCALLLDCRDLGYSSVAFAEGLRVMICDTRAPRRLAGSEYGERRAQCESGARQLGVAALRDATLADLERAALSDTVTRRCRFIIEESLRVLALAEALPRGDRAAISGLCAASFAGARDLYEICSRAMLDMHAAMLAAPGVVGARQAGAGFGGCLVAFVEASASDAFAAAVVEHYHRSSGLQAEIYAVDPAAGACVFEP